MSEVTEERATLISWEEFCREEDRDDDCDSALDFEPSVELCLEIPSCGLARLILMSPSELSLDNAFEDNAESSVSESSKGRRAATTAASA